MKITAKALPATSNDLRTFGLLIGGVFTVIAIWPMFWQLPMRAWAMAIAAMLMLPAILWPPVLRLPHRLWLKIGAILGWFNTRLILTILYFVAILPIALLLKLTGRTPLKLGFDHEAETYREPPEDQSENNISEQF